MRKLTIVISIAVGIAFFSLCYFLIFLIIIPEQSYDDKFCSIVNIKFAEEIEEIYINNGRSVRINLFNSTVVEKTRKEIIHDIFTFITEAHQDIDRIDEIDFAFLPPEARYFAPEYTYFRTSSMTLKLFRSLKNRLGFEAPKRSEGWKFKRFNRH